jgi:hypothetical protein
MGRRETFAMVAGRCSAAEAEHLRELRNGKQYKTVASTWDDFCTRYLHISKASADRIIRLLDRFGPRFFELSNLTRISSEAYTSVAPSMFEEGLRWNGEAIPLLPENAEKLTAAVAEICKTALPVPDPPPSTTELLDALARRTQQVIAEFNRLADAGPDADDRERLLTLLQESRGDLAQIQMRIGG